MPIDHPPICPGTERHFQVHDFGGFTEEEKVGPEEIYWPDDRVDPFSKDGRIWSHDSDYPWQMRKLERYQREHIARHQIVAWQRRQADMMDQMEGCALDESQREKELRRRLEDARRAVRGWTQWEREAETALPGQTAHGRRIRDKEETRKGPFPYPPEKDL